MHSKFCRLAEEFHTERGLPLEGVDPRSLSGNNDISDEVWEAVFTCPRPVPGSQKKVKAYHARSEFLQKIVSRHWDVYQEGPFMYEVGTQFAKAFALENCREASSSPGKHQIAWAVFAERAMKASEERHNLQSKMKRWEEQMSGRGLGSRTTAASTRSSVRTEKMPSLPLSSVPTGGCLVQLEEDDIRVLEVMKNIAETRVQDCKSRLEDAKKQVENEVRELHRAEGAQGSNTLAMKLQMQIDCMQDPVDRQRLIDLIGEFSSSPLEKIAELEAKVAMAKVLHILPSYMCLGFFWSLWFTSMRLCVFWSVWLCAICHVAQSYVLCST